MIDTSYRIRHRLELKFFHFAQFLLNAHLAAHRPLSRRPFLGQVAFHLRQIWLQTLVAIDSESCLTSFPRFCAPPSEVAVLLDSNLSRRPVLGQVVDLVLLLCTGFNLEHAVFFYVIFLLRDQ